MNIYKKIEIYIISAVMCIAGMLGGYSAEALGLPSSEKSGWGELVAHYNANDLEIFSGRTKQEIADRYSEALYSEPSYDNDNHLTWYAELPSTTYPYNPGKISWDTHSAMIAMTNFYRWMVGCDPIRGISYDEDRLPLQTGALVRNFCWQHIVIDSFKPEDMDDEMWQKGAVCDHNILAQDYTPLGAVTAWMSEGYDYEIETWKSVGHRAIIMNYKLDEMAYGFCGRIAIGKGNTINKTNDLPFTAYPSPGYMPSNIVNPRNCSWSVKLNDENFEIEDIEGVTVTITNTRTGQEWVRRYNDETLIYSFGLLAFAQPNDQVDMQYSDSYRVDITGIHDKMNDAAAQFTYTIDFFDMTDYVQTQVSSANTCRKYMVAPEMMTEDNLKKIAAILPEEIEIVADNKQTFTVPVKGEWQLDMENQRFVNSGDLSQMPSRLSDPYGYLNEIVIPYVEKTDICALYDTIDIIPQDARTGDKVNISVYRTNSSTDTVHIFRLKKNGDGSYSAERVFNSKEADVPEGEVADGFDIESVSDLDSGEYISVYYDGTWLADRYTTPIQVSNSVAVLNVETIKYDINGDNAVDLRDVVTMEKILNGLAKCRSSADINGDGRVNVFDQMLLKQQVKSLI
ncbi:MAG: dockerin type I repeat-containing protein [Oscillospiraceae bacterium]|nr:dockerin type I repeat-containing protein [Oscillospiraceae bacterium]